MKTYEDIAAEIGLDDGTTKRFIAYMRERWTPEESLQCQVGSAQEWEKRFKGGYEYMSSDLTGQTILRKAHP